jgi:hypothetical protein
MKRFILSLALLAIPGLALGATCPWPEDCDGKPASTFEAGGIDDAVEATCTDVFNCSAAGSGSDSLTAIQAAVDAACAAGGGHVWLQEGSYRVSGPILINCDDIHFECAPGTTIYPHGVASTQLMRICADVGCVGTNVISDVTVEGCHFKDDDPESRQVYYVVGQSTDFTNSDTYQIAIASFDDYNATIPNTTKVTTAGAHNLGNVGVQLAVQIYDSSSTYNDDWLATIIDADEFWISVPHAARVVVSDAIQGIPRNGALYEDLTAGGTGRVISYNTSTGYVRFWQDDSNFADGNDLKLTTPPASDNSWRLNNVDLDCAGCGLEPAGTFAGIWIDTGKRITLRKNIFTNINQYSVRSDASSTTDSDTIRLEGNIYYGCPGVPTANGTCVLIDETSNMVLDGERIEGGYAGASIGSPTTSTDDYISLVHIYAESSNITIEGNSELVDLEDWDEFGEGVVRAGIRLTATGGDIGGIVKMLGGQIDVATNNENSGAVWADDSRNDVTELLLSHVERRGVIRFTTPGAGASASTLRIVGGVQYCEGSEYSAIAGTYERLHVNGTRLEDCHKRNISIWGNSGSALIENSQFINAGANIEDDDGGIIDTKGYSFSSGDFMLRNLLIEGATSWDTALDIHGVACYASAVGLTTNCYAENVTVRDADGSGFFGVHRIDGGLVENPTDSGVEVVAVQQGGHVRNLTVTTPGDHGIEVLGGNWEVSRSIIDRSTNDAIESDAGAHVRCIGNVSLGAMAIFTVNDAKINNGPISVGDDVELEAVGAPDGVILTVDTGTPGTYTFLPDDVTDDDIDTADNLREQGGGGWDTDDGITVIQDATAAAAIDCNTSQGSTEVDNVEAPID